MVLPCAPKVLLICTLRVPALSSPSTANCVSAVVGSTKVVNPTGVASVFLGLTIGLIQADMQPDERRPAYAADVTYGTNNEFGFDYLRDNMAMDPQYMVQRGHNYAIVDEVDSILIDEARTPLIISGRVGESAKWYRDFARIADRLRDEVHYEVDEG